MEHPGHYEISCGRCGLISRRRFLSCDYRAEGACPYVFQGKTSPPGKFPGSIMIGMGLVFLIVLGSMPFLSFSKQHANSSSLVVCTLALTFSFTIAIIFLLVGLVFAGLRRWLFYDAAQLRYVEMLTLWSMPLAHRLVVLGDTIPVQVGSSPLPLSLAGFLMGRSRSVFPVLGLEPPPEIHSRTLNRLTEVNAELDQGIAHALFGAIAHLASQSCVVFRSARQEVFSRWYPAIPVYRHYIYVGDGPAQGLGLLEEDLMKKIVNWRSQEWKVEDIIAPTFSDLVEAHKDQDGDFSAYQIRKLLLADGLSRKVFKKTSEGILGRLLPKIDPAPEAADEIKKAQEVIEAAARALFHGPGRLGNDISLALRKTVFGQKMADPLEERNAALRNKLLCYVICISFVLAFALCCIASL